MPQWTPQEDRSDQLVERIEAGPDALPAVSLPSLPAEMQRLPLSGIDVPRFPR